MATKKEIEDLVVSVRELSKQVESLIESGKQKVVEVVEPVAEAQAQVIQSAPSAPSLPIPVEYRDIVDTILNKKFEVDIRYLGDSAVFEFSILVPKEYSNAPKSHWDTIHEDRRSRIIVNALGSNGVREWAQKVYDNFDPETRSKITYDRGQL